jgi:hypothetical protein
MAAAVAAVADAVLALAPVRDASLLLACVDTDSEIPTDALIASVLASNSASFCRASTAAHGLLPSIDRRRAPRPGAYGILAPQGRPETRTAGDSGRLLPLLAWDDAGGHQPRRRPL